VFIPYLSSQPVVFPQHVKPRVLYKANFLQRYQASAAKKTSADLHLKCSSMAVARDVPLRKYVVCRRLKKIAYWRASWFFLLRKYRWVIKSKGVKWVGHVARVGKKSNKYMKTWGLFDRASCSWNNLKRQLDATR